MTEQNFSFITNSSAPVGVAGVVTVRKSPVTHTVLNQHGLTNTVQVVESLPLSRGRNIVYSIKIVNPQKKFEYTVQKMQSSTVFESVEDLKQKLSAIEGIPSTIEQLGYIEPGHGLRGKQQWIQSSEDIKAMYTINMGKDEIVLWCNGPQMSSSSNKKRSHSPEPEDGGNTAKKRSRYGNHTDKMIEVEEIEDKLFVKHGRLYSKEQFRAWAHLIQMGKHVSYDTPPQKPFWKKPSGVDAVDENPTISVTPSKSVQLKGQLVYQLLKWHELLEKGEISQGQYDELQESIMKDVKKF